MVAGEFNTNDRPDFRIERDGKLVGYVEVELGKDIAQVKKYEEKTPDHVKIYTVFGKRSDGGTLSLEEIYYFLKEAQCGFKKDSQDYWSTELFLKLVKYYVIEGNFKSNNKRTSISEQMRKSSLVNAIYEGIGENHILGDSIDKAQKGKLLINTVGENGFSIRVFARNSSSNSFSIMNRSGGRETISFPAYVKMKKYIANKEFIERYTTLLIQLGCDDIKEIGERQFASLPIMAVENNIDKIIDCIKILLH